MVAAPPSGGSSPAADGKAQGPAAVPAQPAPSEKQAEDERVLDAYGCLWSLHQAAPFLDSAFGLAGAYDARPLFRSDWLLRLPVLLPAMALRTRRALVLAHLCNMAFFLARTPIVWDHMCWSALTELTFVATMLCSGSEPGAAERFVALARAQMVMLYASAAFWKLTTSFLDTHTSCASLLVAELLGTFAPPSLPLETFPAAQAALRAAPAATVLGEAAIAVLLALLPHAGLLLAMLFHFSILLLPVNYAGGFSLACGTRLFFFAAGGTARGLALAGSAFWRPAVALAAAAVANRVVRGGVDANFLAFCMASALHLHAVWLERGAGGSGPASSSSAGRGPLRAAVLAATFAYGFLGPVLGLHHMGSSTMYSNTKLYGGSNHLLVPTGVLQDLFGGPAGPPWLADAFAGGLVRVDSTNSSTLLTLSPADASDLLPNKTQALLRSIGASAKYFMQYTMRILEREDGQPSGDPVAMEAMLPYVVPAYELRRLLQRARARGEPFSVNITRLPNSLRTPGQWRDYRGTATVLEESGSTRRCTREGGPCGSDELALLEPPPRWLAALLLPYPVPLLPSDTTEIHCSA